MGSFAINPVIGLLSAFTNHMLGMHFNRQELPKIIDKYKKEIKKVEGKLENASGEKKTRLERYLHELNYGLDKLNNQYDAIRTEKEKEDDFNSSFDDDMDFDFSFDEAVVNLAVELQVMERILESIDMDVFKGFSPITESAVDLDADILEAYAACSSALIHDNNIRAGLLESLNEEYQRLKTDRKPNHYVYLEYARSARATFEQTKLLEGSDEFLYNANALTALYEVCTAVQALKESSVCVDSITEDTSMTNKLKLSAEKLKKTAANLSDKEKMMSKRIDGSMESLRRSIEKSLTTDNREAIIKGQIVPSASKIIKMAITGGAAWMINPAIAVIGAIGSLAMSKKLQKKERQLLLDEINIELEMCEKYLKIAEDKDDMKATRELLQIQKRLEREKARITHKAKYDYNTHIDTGTSDRD